jgi:hypothetical protein
MRVFMVMPGVLMIPTRQLNDYVREQGLKLDRTELQIAVMTLQAVLDVEKAAAAARSVPLSGTQAER